jgi:hypothetical protein
VLEAQAKRLNEDALQLAVMRDRLQDHEGLQQLAHWSSCCTAITHRVVDAHDASCIV